MCGIFGYVAWDREMPPVDDLCRVTNLLRHRGPDGGGWWRDPGVFLGHRRLAVIDIATGDQPMTDASGRYVITFNGEIYNYPELREELRQEGAHFRTSSDTEVLLHGLGAWGTDLIPRLEGMFAFGVYDRRERTLLLARDRFGEKPLLYSDHDGRVAFASELAPLVAAGAGRGGLDVEALGAYLALNYVPGSRTLLRDVRRVAPGEWRLYGSDGLRGHAQYWTPPAVRPASPALREGELLDALEARIDRAARLALRSDVPVGLFLSGGVDSSVVAEAAARAGRLSTAFCVDMAADGFSEWPAASAVARRLGVDLVRVPLEPRVLDEFLAVAAHLDDPLADSSAMAVWTVSRAAAAHVKVVIGGDGGDELFAGYLTYPATRWHARLRRVTPAWARDAAAGVAARLPVNDGRKVGLDYKLRRFLRAMPLPSGQAHFTWNGTWLPSSAAGLVHGEGPRRAASDALGRLAAAHGLDRASDLHALQVADIRDYLANDILAKVDRATMAHGLESRAPLLNPEVAALALSLPDRLRVRGSTTKVALRQVCARRFGREHAFAPKQGFSIPIHRWLRSEGRALVENLLAPDRVRALGVLDADAVQRAARAHLSGAEALGWEIWGLMVLVTWFEQRVAHPPRAGDLPPARDLREVTLSAVAAGRP